MSPVSRIEAEGIIRSLVGGYSPKVGDLIVYDAQVGWKFAQPEFSAEVEEHDHDDRYYTKTEVDALLDELEPIPVTPPALTMTQVWPVGSVFPAFVDTDPSILLGIGTWARIGEGRVLVGQDDSDPDFDTAGLTGGEKEHTLTTAEMPSHTHTQDAHNHLQDAHQHEQRVVNSAVDGVVGVRGSDDANTSSDGLTAGTTATNQAATATNQNTGGGDPHNNMPPFFVVYFWKRTA